MKPLIDLERDRMLYTARKLKGTDLPDEQLAEELNRCGDEWLAAPNSLLGSKTPSEWFDDCSEEEALELLREYCKRKITVPDVLYRHILKIHTEVGIENVIKDPDGPEEARVIALEILIEAHPPKAVRICPDLIFEPGAVGIRAGEFLKENGSMIRDELSEKWEEADSTQRDILLDILVSLPACERTVQLLGEALLKEPEKAALHASMCIHYGDPGLIGPLKALAGDPELGYYDYDAVSAAVDALGGEPLPYREFSGDPDYEFMRDLPDTAEETE